METSKLITWKIEDDIGILTIENPPQNCLPEPDFLERKLFKEWTGHDGLKGVIIHGKGRHFSAGADLDALRGMARDQGVLLSKIKKGKDLLTHLETIDVPAIAAIEGVCFGGGLEIALACHIRVCSENSLLAFPEVNHNLMPGLGGTIRLPRLIGYGRALETVLSGDMIEIERALAIGLIDHIVPGRSAFEFSLHLIKKMVADRPVEVIRSVVQALNNSRTMSEQEAMEEETKMFCRLAVKLHE